MSTWKGNKPTKKGHKFQQGEEERFLSICTKETLKPLELGEYLSRWSISYCTSRNGWYFSYRHQSVQETLLKCTSKNFGLYWGVSDVLAGFMCFRHKNPSRLVFIFYTDLTFFSVLSLDLSVSSSLEHCCCSFSFFFFFLVLSLSFSLCFFCFFLLPNAFWKVCLTFLLWLIINGWTNQSTHFSSFFILFFIFYF